jgi:hypothetical protein
MYKRFPKHCSSTKKVNFFFVFCCHPCFCYLTNKLFRCWDNLKGKQFSVFFLLSAQIFEEKKTFFIFFSMFLRMGKSSLKFYPPEWMKKMSFIVVKWMNELNFYSPFSFSFLGKNVVSFICLNYQRSQKKQKNFNTNTCLHGTSKKQSRQTYFNSINFNEIQLFSHNVSAQ